jgi:hypothetical protein
LTPQSFDAAHTAAVRHYKDLSTDAFHSDLEGTGKKVVFARMEYHSEWRTCTRWLLFRSAIMSIVIYARVADSKAASDCLCG